MILNKKQLETNLDHIFFDIEKARLKVSKHHIVKLIIVSKYTEIENIEMLYTLGHRAFGENQVQQLKTRQKKLSSLPLEWHMIGALQKNKINNLIDLRPTLMHSLDSIELAKKLNEKLQAKNSTMNCLLQINSSKETNKHGVSTESAIDIYRQIKMECININLKGIMTIGAHTDNKRVIRKSFEITHDIYQKLQKDGANICSMGMSNDFRLAIEHGSNMIRVGSSLFQQ